MLSMGPSAIACSERAAPDTLLPLPPAAPLRPAGRWQPCRAAHRASSAVIGLDTLFSAPARPPSPASARPKLA